MSSEAVFLKSVVDLNDLPESDRPHIALAGRSNVGKSSLVNSLAGRTDLARVSSEPGRTRTLNFYSLDRTYYLVDLPGYGFVKGHKGRRDSFFSKFITSYLQGATQIKLVFVVIDGRIGPTDLDLKMLAFLKAAGLQAAIIANKADKLSNSQRADMKRRLAKEHPDVPHYFHSTQSNEYRGEIRHAIEKAVHA